MSHRYAKQFSIIIPAWNRPDLLAGCLQALEKLKYPKDEFEIIIIDDGSLCPLSNVLQRFNDALPLRLYRQSNLGPAAARNLGAHHASGEYLVFTDDDCRPTSDWLNLLSVRVKKSPNSAISGRRVNICVNNVFSIASEIIAEVACAHFNGSSGNAGFISTSNLSLPARRFKEIGGFDESFRTAEDRDLGQRWRERGYFIYYAPEIVVYHANSLSLTKLWKRYFKIGQGARQFADAGSLRGQRRPLPDLNFYIELLCYPFFKKRQKAFILSGLIGVAQTANAMGYFGSAIKKNKSDT